MNRSIQFTLVLAVISLLLPIIATESQTVSPTATANPTPTAITAHTPLLDQRLSTLESKVSDLEKQSEIPQKDTWDKINATSSLISGILVAAIGALATYYFNKRSKEIEEARKDRELAVARVQAIQAFMSQLLALDPKTQKTALIIIATIDKHLAKKLAQDLQNQEAIEELSRPDIKEKP